MILICLMVLTLYLYIGMELINYMDNSMTRIGIHITQLLIPKNMFMYSTLHLKLVAEEIISLKVMNVSAVKK